MRRSIQWLTGLLVAAGSSFAVAQESGIQIGEMTLYPTLGVGVGYDDNVTIEPAGSDISGWYYQISPAVRLLAGSTRSRVQLGYAIEHAVYDSNLDDYTDHIATAEWNYEPTARSNLAIAGRYMRGHDGRGEGARDLIPGTLPLPVDEYNEFGVDGRYRYGAEGARGRLDLRAGILDREYRNNLELTERLDFQRMSYGAEFQWRVASKTSVLFEAGIADYDYDTSDRDSREYFYGLGLAWDATARTDGRASVRYLEKEFDDSARQRYSGIAWEVAMRWRPRDYSIVEAATSRSTDEAFTPGAFLIREQVDVSWRHEWRPRFATILDAGWLDEEFAPGFRSDDSVFYGLGVSYAARSWLNLGASYRYSDRDSSLAPFDYSRNHFLLSFEITP